MPRSAAIQNATWRCLRSGSVRSAESCSPGHLGLKVAEGVRHRASAAKSAEISARATRALRGLGRAPCARGGTEERAARGARAEGEGNAGGHRRARE